MEARPPDFCAGDSHAGAGKRIELGWLGGASEREAAVALIIGRRAGPRHAFMDFTELLGRANFVLPFYK